jgi:hypothetical protein
VTNFHVKNNAFQPIFGQKREYHLIELIIFPSTSRTLIMRLHTKWFVCVSVQCVYRQTNGSRVSVCPRLHTQPGVQASEQASYSSIHPLKEEADGKSQVDVRASAESGIVGGGGGTAAATVPPLRAACQSHQPESRSQIQSVSGYREIRSESQCAGRERAQRRSMCRSIFT